MSDDLELSDLEQRIQEGPPADWKPDWGRWQRVIHAAKAHLQTVNTLTTENATLKAALETEKTGRATEVGSLRGQIEEAQIAAISGLKNPNLKLFRTQYDAEMAELPESKRPTFVDWTKGKAEAENPEPWILGYLGTAEEPTAGPVREPTNPRPPADPKRLPAPPPKGGFTDAQIEAMTPEEFKANQAAIQAQINGGA